MRALLPSHREKKRYLLLVGKDVSRENVEQAILKFIGSLGYSRACPSFIKTEKGKIVLSINRGEVDKVRASFPTSGKDIRVSNVSGMINKV